ncbi:MAG: DUF4215 domain-containing protein [Myxococcota bacterium]
MGCATDTGGLGPPSPNDAGAEDQGAADGARADGSQSDAAPDVGSVDATTGDAPPSDLSNDADGAPGAVCGNGVEEGDEACDDGNDSNDDICLTSCEFACGDGVVNAVESCDTAIASDEDGACPTACDSGDACMPGALSGSGCGVECVFGAISACADDDGCCAPGCTALDDNDCMPMCGNGAIEAGETCEAGVGAGCPARCDDGDVCTRDALMGSVDACTAECGATPIESCTNDDGCCGPGCNASNDNDCSASCGNGTIEPGESCEPGVGMGCPTSCDDGMVCTRDTLSGSAANCNASCTSVAITACDGGDGCCAPGCNARNDSDCSPVCGNGVMEPGEDCDDANADPNDGCDACMTTSSPVAFRMSDLDLRDPHAFADVFGCRDITDTVFGFDGVNPQFQAAIQTDGDSDGLLDLSFVLAFDSLDQSDGGTGDMSFVVADCTTAPIRCTADTSLPLTYTSQSSGACLGLVPGTTRGYSPAIAQPDGPCFVTDAADVSFTLSGIAIRLRDAQLGAQYVGSPATQLSRGLLRGFMTLSDAQASILPDTLPLVGGQSLAAVLRGGPGNCSFQSDMDDHPIHGRGWWFYMNFPAAEVNFTP